MPDHWYPGANLNHRYDRLLPGTIYGTPDKVVLHSTEGTGLPPYRGGTQAPHLTLVPNLTINRLEVVQHFPFNMNSRALRNESGGVETNHARAVQIEIVGTCVRATHLAWANAGRKHLYMPELPAWVLYDLGKLIERLNWQYGIPFDHPLFESYERLSPGAISKRFSPTAWRAFKGICGHQHVPENTHLDPGNIPIAQITAYARTLKEDRTMPSSEDVAKAVAAYPIRNKNVEATESKTTIGGALTDIEWTQDRHGVRLAAIEKVQGDILLQLNVIQALLTPKDPS